MKPIVRHLQDLELTDQENALMSSVCVMHPGQFHQNGYRKGQFFTSDSSGGSRFS